MEREECRTGTERDDREGRISELESVEVCPVSGRGRGKAGMAKCWRPLDRKQARR
jgi:hypothetical protein